MERRKKILDCGRLFIYKHSAMLFVTSESIYGVYMCITAYVLYKRAITLYIKLVNLSWFKF